MRLKTQRDQICEDRQVIGHIGLHQGRINFAWEMLELDNCVIKGSSGVRREKGAPGQKSSTYSAERWELNELGVLVI